MTTPLRDDINALIHQVINNTQGNATSSATMASSRSDIADVSMQDVIEQAAAEQDSDDDDDGGQVPEVSSLRQGRQQQRLNKSPLELFLDEGIKVKSDHRMTYILMCGRGIASGLPAEEAIWNLEPFKTAIDLKLCKLSKLQYNKQLIATEIKRRNPDRLLNMNNTKKEKFFEILSKEVPLENEDDVKYIKEEVSSYIQNLKDSIDDALKRKQQSVQRIKREDRLRFICAIDEFDDLRLLYT